HYLRTDLLDQGTRTFAEDKINLTVDLTGGPHSGNVYAAWDELAPPARGGFPRDLMRVSRSTDHGATFSPPRPASAIVHAMFPDLAVGPSGTVYLAFPVETQFWMAVSTDGGAHFHIPSLVGDTIPFE